MHLRPVHFVVLLAVAAVCSGAVTWCTTNYYNSFATSSGQPCAFPFTDSHGTSRSACALGGAGPYGWCQDASGGWGDCVPCTRLATGAACDENSQCESELCSNGFCACNFRDPACHCRDTAYGCTTSVCSPLSYPPRRQWVCTHCAATCGLCVDSTTYDPSCTFYCPAQDGFNATRGYTWAERPCNVNGTGTLTRWCTIWGDWDRARDVAVNC